MGIEVITIKIVLLLCLIFCLGIFTGGETALTSLSILDLEKQIKTNPKKAKYYMDWQKDPGGVICNMLLWTNVICVAIAVLSISLAIDMHENFKGNKEIYLLVLSIISTLLILLFGEILPKVYARASPISFLNPIISVIHHSIRVVTPLIKLFMKISKAIVKLITKKHIVESSLLTADDLREILRHERALSGEHLKLIESVIEFGDKKIKEVATPKVYMHMLNIDTDIKNLLKSIKEMKYSRIPLYKDTQENIIGVLYTKDLLALAHSPELIKLEDIIRPIHFVPETSKVDSLLREFRTGKYHMAFVVDEYGHVSGLVTIEDIVEEIVGEIYDEYDVLEKTVTMVDKNTYLIDGNESVEKINEILNVNLKPKSSMTLNGFILELCEKIPQVNEKIKFENLIFEILNADRKRIKKVKLIIQ